MGGGDGEDGWVDGWLGRFLGLGGPLADQGPWEAKSLMRMSFWRPSWPPWPAGRFLGLGDHMAAHWWPSHRPSLRWPAPRLPYSTLGYSKPSSKHSKQPPKQPTHTLKKHTDTVHKLPASMQHPDEEPNKHLASNPILATVPLSQQYTLAQAITAT